MKKSALFGIWLVAITFIYELTITSTLFSDTKIRLDVFPAFLGFIFIFLGLENLKYDNRALKACANAAIALSVPTFIIFAAQLSPYYLPMIVTIKDSGTITGTLAPLAHFLIFIFRIYHDYENLFFCIYTIFLAVFCIALMTEIKHRQQNAGEFEAFSKKDAYGTMHYNRKAHKLYTALSALFAIIFLAQAVLYLINQQLQIDIAITPSLHIQLWTILLPINILFAVYANTAVRMIAEPRPEDTQNAD